MSNLLTKFQDDKRNVLTQTHADLCGSILSAFEGYRCQFDNAERFTLRHNGLVEIGVSLRLELGLIRICITADIGLSYGEVSKLETYESDKYGRSQRTKVDLKGLSTLVESKIKLKSQWDLTLMQYNKVSFQKDVQYLDDAFLSDLVRLLEKSGFVPRRQILSKVF